MPIVIPAICNNLSCGAIFPSGFAVAESSGPGGAHIINCASGPCPVCGSMGRVPSGEYSAATNILSAKLHSISDVQLLNNVFKAVENALKQKSKKQIKQSLKNTDDSWKEVWNLIPENKADAYAFLTLILSFIATAIAIYSVTGNPGDTTTIINQSFDRYYQIEPPKENRNENKKPQIKPLIQAIRRNLT